MKNKSKKNLSVMIEEASKPAWEEAKRDSEE